MNDTFVDGLSFFRRYIIKCSDCGYSGVPECIRSGRDYGLFCPGCGRCCGNRRL